MPPWHLLELPKSFSGLSIGSLLHRNFALLFKWVWRFFSEPNALWQHVMMNKYRYSPHLTIHDLVPPSKGGPWSKICKAVLVHLDASPLLKTKIRKRIGSRLNT